MYAFTLGILVLAIALFLLIGITKFFSQLKPTTSEQVVVLVFIMGGVITLLVLGLSVELFYDAGYHAAIQDVVHRGRAVITDTLYIAKP